MIVTFNDLREVVPMINLFKRRDEKREAAAGALVKKGRDLCGEAETEAKHALTAANLMRNSADEKLRQDFRAIANWHHARAARKYREAAALFREVKNHRVSTKTREHFARKAKKMISSAAENERAGSNL